MNFQFHPWERLTEEVTDGEADARVQIEGKIWLYRRCGALHFARPIDCEHNYLLRLVCLAVNASGSDIWEEPDATRLPMFLKSDERYNRLLGRVWQLEEKVIAIWSSGEGWNLYRSAAEYARDKRGIKFQFSSGRSAPSDKIYAALRKSRDKSALAQAMPFCALTDDERALYFVETQGGTPQELLARLEVALRAMVAAWPAGAPEISIELFASNWEQGKFTLRTNDQFGARERAILGHLLRDFAPRLIALKTISPALAQWRTNLLRITVARPSAHEQIEAALQLRAWLQTHWPGGVKHLGKVV